MWDGVDTLGLSFAASLMARGKPNRRVLFPFSDSYRYQTQQVMATE